MDDQAKKGCSYIALLLSGGWALGILTYWVWEHVALVLR